MLIAPHMLVTFLLFVIILTLSPGPNVVMSIHCGSLYQFKRAVWVVPGIVLAAMVYGLSVSFGLSHLVTYAPLIFKALRLLGAGYLMYLASQYWMKAYHAKKAISDCMMEEVIGTDHPLQLMRQGFLCCILNPKIFILYIALLPHFINTQASALPQLLFLSVIHWCILAIGLLSYCALACSAKSFLKKYKHYQCAVTGTIMFILAIIVLVHSVG